MHKIDAKSRHTYTEGYRANYVIDSFYNLDNDQIYICFKGQKYLNNYRLIKNREPEASYVSTIDGYKSREENINKFNKNQQFLNVTDLDKINCDDFMKKHNVARIPIFVATSFNYTENNRMCDITEWSNISSYEDINIINQNQCPLNSQYSKRLTTSLIDDQSLINGVYVTYTNDKYTDNGAKVSFIRLKNKQGVFPFTPPGEIRKKHPFVLALLPFAIVFDLITFPFQLIHLFTDGFH
ncbi:hypothetical protein ACFL3P_01535 [Pseudomonadota bacterium]